ncbi:MAG: PrsW family glutamic-type intramembrane protease [Bacteroidales bacterium]
MIIAFALVPVVLFLACLYLLDSFKLVGGRVLVACLGWGMAAAVISFFVNRLADNYFDLGADGLSRFVAPVTEETFKMLLLVVLIARRRIGFMIDASIYGFAIGTGFALAENFWYFLQLGSDFHALLAIVRGFGTALMHGGTVALCAIVFVEGAHRNKGLPGALLGLGAAIILHATFNHFILNPLFQTLLIISLLPLAFFMVFLWANRHLRQWLEVEFSSEVDMLGMMRRGQFRDTKAGMYLSSIREHFPPETLVDMYCFFSLYLELSIKAKRNMMLQESGFPPIIEKDIKDKLTEFRQLRRQIGKAGEMTLMPLVRMDYRRLWELNQWES